jgi:hypothetical protein
MNLSFFSFNDTLSLLVVRKRREKYEEAAHKRRPAKTTLRAYIPIAVAIAHPEDAPRPCIH